MKACLILISIFILQETVTLTPAAFQKKITATHNAVILDVRTKGEVDEGIIAGAINIDINGERFQSQIEKLDRNKTYFLYCKGGVRSNKALNLMKSMGFQKVYELAGGFDAWKDAGLKVEKK